MVNSDLEDILSNFAKHVNHLPDIPDLDEDIIVNIKLNIKHLYDLTKAKEPEGKGLNNNNNKNKQPALKQLIVKNFDLEQIWQQVELQNDEILESIIKDLSSKLVSKDRLIFHCFEDALKNANNDVELDSNSSESDQDEDANLIEMNDENDDLSSELNSSINEEDNNDENDTTEIEGNHQRTSSSIVDDDFFKLSEMNKFLENEEKRQEKGNNKLDVDTDDEDNESINLFEEDDDNSADEAKTARFKDYFVSKEEEIQEPKRKRNRLMEELDEDDNDDNNTRAKDCNINNNEKSSLELRQERLQKKIQHFEEQAVGEKPWQLKGEITADKRPQNSLLEEIVEFDLSTRPAPIITTQTSLQLEDIIRQRIKDKTFDSVERKIRPVDTPFEFRKELVLNQEKSKESLAQIYEKEYLQQENALNQDKMKSVDEVEEAEEPESHKQIKKTMNDLFRKLDALSNYHFTSTPAIPELKVISNLAAVNMEEVAPVSYSDATLLAPEEIKNKSKGDLIGKSEKTTTDQKRERRKKKLKQKIHSKRKEEREKNGINIKKRKVNKTK